MLQVKTETPAEAAPLGLTSDEVREKVARGEVNRTKDRTGKSIPRIIAENLFTFFNMVWAAVAVLLIVFHSPGNLNFLFVVIPNLLIAVILEIRAKRTVEKLSVTTDPRVTVIRDGKPAELRGDELVTGDVFRVELGQQILSDARVISGVCEVNESMLTGESDAIRKQEGDTLLAGSFLVSGGVYAEVVRVGKDNYVHRIEKEARSYKAPSSDLFRDLNKLIKYIAAFMVPMTFVLAFSNYRAYHGDVQKTVEMTSGSVIGMIPAGIYLLVTVTLTLSVIKLARKKTLVQDMYSIEMLARADVLCLDKTGTITDGTMHVTDVLPLGDATDEEITAAMACIEGAEESINNTSRALIDRFGRTEGLTVTERVPFSSERKYSAVSAEGAGIFSLGAPHFVKAPVDEETDRKIAAYAAKGERVLLLAKHDKIDTVGVPMALIAIADRIRPNAGETIRGFQEQGVTIKIISGDHAATVSSIAKRVGVLHAEKYLSCEGLSDERLVAEAENYTVFGRVTPEQKVLLIKTLRKNGHTVAMTGDGVNDTLALKESNCAIAMADGSSVASKVSQIVLTNSDFATLPDVVREGRRCINNVRMSAVLFLMKTFFTIGLSLYAVATFSGYPLQPKDLMLIETFVIGIAAVLLALEPNNKRIEGSFISTVIRRSLPNAIALLLPAIALVVLRDTGVIDAATCSAMVMSAVTIAGFVNLIGLCRPYTRWRIAVIIAVLAMVVVTLIVNLTLLGDWLAIRKTVENLPLFFFVAGVSALFAALMQVIRPLLDRLLDRIFGFFSRLHKKKRKVA